MTNGRHQPQQSFDETLIENLALADALKNRQDAKIDLQPYRLAYQGADKTVKGLLEQLDLSEGTFRCGAFIIKVSETDEHHIEFERQSSKRISISPAKT